MKAAPLALAALALAATACGPRLARVQENGALLPPVGEQAVAAARAQGDAERTRLAAAEGRARAAALAGCGGAECVVTEAVPGMTEAQLLAATGTTTDAWDERGSGPVRVLVGRAVGGSGPADTQGEIAWAALQNGRIRTLVRREPQGLRTVSSPGEATFAARAAAQADALLRQGDDYLVGGNLPLALDRFDRADVLRPNHPATTLRIAQLLDKQLRPFEAALRYRQFVNQLEIERIRARGEAAAQMAAAIAAARERVIVLERR